MKRKSLFIVVIVVLFQAFVPSFLYAESIDNSTKQPEVCSWPSEMMSNYFNFQYEAINILLWSKANERTLSVSFSGRGLFSQKILSLSAIDLVASSFLSNVLSSASNLLTSAVLVLLVSASVVQSNLEWLAILFKDRPVVRDYKEMLDIETQLFDVAYFRSKQINLLRPIEWDMLRGFRELVDKYEDKWLFAERTRSPIDITMADIILDLLSMNAAMKHFITAGSGLGAYYWCLWVYDKNNCSKDTAVLKFSESAINQLSSDYKEVRSFSACNPFLSSFVSSIDKAVSNGKDSVKTSFQDVKDSMNNLKWALVGGGRWNFKNNRKGLCDWISDYEMAQLRAYRWQNRRCWGRVDVSVDVWDISSALMEVKQYSKEKKSQREQKGKQKSLNNTISEGGSIVKDLSSMSSTSEKEDWYYERYWSDINPKFNPNFSLELESHFEDIFEETMNRYWQSLENAISSDISSLFPKGKWILDQIDTTMWNTDNLKNVLQKIADKQCSG